jgi:mannose-6-phosphate isomerase
MATGPFALENPVLHYAWGSRTAIAELLGRTSPADRPEAELWIGAHPKAPSRVVPPPELGTLDRAIQDDPVGLLGSDVCDSFGNELPFLLKVLAAAEPLSIQAHPDQEQARQGWARENEEGTPLDAPRRNYRDPNHKPELVCALTPFTVLKGFRPPDELAGRLEPIAGSELNREVGRLGRERNPAALRALFTRLMTLEPEERDAVITRAMARAASASEDDPEWRWVERLQSRYPGDVGALSPLYLNLATLAPQEALFLSAGELHSYLDGTALEIMANSDNVLRGGLTPKHVDVPELLNVLTFETREPEIIRGRPTGPTQQVFRTPAREFELSLVQVAAGATFDPEPGRGVEILLGIEGKCVLLTDERDLPLGRGRAAFVPAGVPSYEIGGTGRVARARVPA